MLLIVTSLFDNFVAKPSIAPRRIAILTSALEDIARSVSREASRSRLDHRRNGVARNQPFYAGPTNN
jgi:hypothetical protein